MTTPREPEREDRSLWSRVGEYAQSFSLTAAERMLVTAILLSLLVGSLVMHYRREYRLNHPPPEPQTLAR